MHLDCDTPPHRRTNPDVLPLTTPSTLHHHCPHRRVSPTPFSPCPPHVTFFRFGPFHRGLMLW